jgi:hypothetical protein
MITEKQYKRVEAIISRAEKLVSILEARFDPCPVQKAQEHLLDNFDEIEARFEASREAKIVHYPRKGSGIHEEIL